MRAVVILALLMVLPGPGRAQEGPPAGDPPRAGGTAAFLFKVTPISDEQRVFLGGWAGLTFGRRFSLGGGGVAMVKDAAMGGGESGSGFAVGMGYGGLVLQYRYPLRTWVQPRLDLLIGAGHAEVRDRLMSREIGADNFGVFEPEAAVSFTIHPWLRLAGAVGYRWTWGVEDLPLVSSEELDGLTTTLSIRLGSR